MDGAPNVSEESLREKIKQQLEAIHVDIEDMSGGCGQAYSVTIVSSLFEKKSSLRRHRLVNTTLKDEISAIHAWSAKCLTPTQWETLKTNGGHINENK
ncbi:hypothetical protein K3495_g7914 [Podosphaera aphanis]|nr:hypothetical protein K3495_g7914 [Podosphaera aphanis]